MEEKPMHGTANDERCASKGCGHPKSAHVHDRVMHEGAWIVVARCPACEHDGGPCTDERRILEPDP
jgi:hypothetical protein